MTAILALDLSSKTGWALLDREGGLRSGVESFVLVEAEHPGSRYMRFREWVRRLATTTETRTELTGENTSAERVCHAPAVELIAWERVISFGGRMRADSLLFALEAQVVEVAYRLGIETRTVDPTSLKKHATGNHQAKKPTMIAAAIRRWGPELEAQKGPDGPAPDDNEADALLVLAHVLDVPAKERG